MRFINYYIIKSYQNMLFKKCELYVSVYVNV